uniref:Uncharacterized protein n=1 Tax=Rhizophora mucronata TaxID=61149 RepID=A0A2P2QSM5_RHIMU
MRKIATPSRWRSQGKWLPQKKQFTIRLLQEKPGKWCFLWTTPPPGEKRSLHIVTLSANPLLSS